MRALQVGGENGLCKTAFERLPQVPMQKIAESAKECTPGTRPKSMRRHAQGEGGVLV